MRAPWNPFGPMQHLSNACDTLPEADLTSGAAIGKIFCFSWLF